MRGNKGITLIALVVTIIVLLILAGVSIAMLLGENGLINNVKSAKVSTIEGQVQEEIKLAVQSAKVLAEKQSIEASSTSISYFAGITDNIGQSGDVAGATNTSGFVTIIGQLREDLTASTTAPTSEGYVTIVPTEVTQSGTYKSTITVTYKSDEYRSATNNNESYIKAVITVENNEFSISIDAYRDGTTATKLY